MFATIKTNGASSIIIHIPHEGSEKSLPALARMLEQNAVFIREGYQEFTTVKPEMTITLGTEVQVQNSDTVIAVTESGHVLDETFVNATPEVFASNAKAQKKAQEDWQRLYREKQVLQDQLETLKQKIADLEKETSED